MLTTHPHHVLKLRMSGVTILRPLYAFAFWTATNLFVPFKFWSCLNIKYIILMCMVRFKAVQNVYQIYALLGDVFRMPYCRASNGRVFNKLRTGKFV